MQAQQKSTCNDLLHANSHTLTATTQFYNWVITNINDYDQFDDKIPL